MDFPGFESTPPTAAAILWIGVGSLVAYWAVSILLAWYRLRRYPGPLSACFSDLWLFRFGFGGKSDEMLLQLRHRWPNESLVRVGPSMLMTDDPAIIFHINRARGGYTRGPWYNSARLDPYEPNMFSTLDGSLHDQLKAKTLAGYSGREIPGLERDVDSQIESMKSLIRDRHLSTEKKTNRLDLAATLQYFTIDSLSQVAFGEDSGFLKTDSDVGGMISGVASAIPFLNVIINIDLLGKLTFNDFVLGIIGPKPTDKAGLGVLMGVAHRAVAPRYEPDAEDKRDMLGSFVRHGLTKRQAESEACLQVVAGSDSSAAVMRATFFFLLTTPHAYARLQKEIDERVADGRISTPITNVQAKGFPYLQAVIRESLRCHPPITSTLPKVVPRGGDTLAGKFVPGGTKISINVWSMMRRQEIFGSDVDVFRPERWINVAPEQLAEMERTVDLNFGHGRYSCAGKTVANLELNKVFVELLRDFDFQIIDPHKPWERIVYGIVLTKNFWVRATARRPTL